MAKLEEITVGSSVKGIISNSTVTIVAVQWYGNNVLEITYKDSHGQPGNQMLLRDEEINLTVMDNNNHAHAATCNRVNQRGGRFFCKRNR